MKRARIKIIILVFAALLLTPIIYSYYFYTTIKVSNRHADQFHQDLIDVMKQTTELNMTDLTRFEWDKMIVFYPYTSREEMITKVGRDWTTYSYPGYYLYQKTRFDDYPLSDESLNKVVFIKGEKVVLDVTFDRKDVDFTEIKEPIYKDKAILKVHGKNLKKS